MDIFTGFSKLHKKERLKSQKSKGRKWKKLFTIIEFVSHIIDLMENIIFYKIL